MESRVQEGECLAKTDKQIGSRRELLVHGAALFSSAAVAGRFIASADAATAAPRTKSPGKSLYDRLGGIFAIAAVVNYFSDEIINDPVAGAKSNNPTLREWHTKQLGRLPGPEVHAHLVGSCSVWRAL